MADIGKEAGNGRVAGHPDAIGSRAECAIRPLCRPLSFGWRGVYTLRCTILP